MDKGLLPALAVALDAVTLLMWFTLAIVAAIAIAYFIYLFTYYKKHLKKGIGISTQTKVKKAAVIFGICLVIIAIGAVVCPLLQGMVEMRIV